MIPKRVKTLTPAEAVNQSHFRVIHPTCGRELVILDFYPYNVRGENHITVAGICETCGRYVRLRYSRRINDQQEAGWLSHPNERDGNGGPSARTANFGCTSTPTSCRKPSSGSKRK